MAYLMSLADRMELEDAFNSVVSRNEPTKTMNIIFNCDECGKSIIEDSKDHDECICNEDGDRWWCDMCHNCVECKLNTIWCWDNEWIAATDDEGKMREDAAVQRLIKFYRNF